MLEFMGSQRVGHYRATELNTVKGFGIVNKAEVDIFLELSCFFNNPVDVGNLISGSPAFSNTSLNIWKFTVYVLLKGFPCGSARKESTCKAGDPGSIPGSGRSPGEGIGYPLQYSWVSLVAQLVKNPPAMQETWIRSLGWEDPLEKGKATHPNILAWRIPWTV